MWNNNLLSAPLPHPPLVLLRRWNSWMMRPSGDAIGGCLSLTAPFFLPFLSQDFFNASVSSSGTHARPPLVLVLPAPSLFACVRICRSNLRAVAPLPRTLLAISMVTFVLMWWGFCFFCFSRCLFVSSADGCESSSDHIFLLTCAGSVPAHHRGRSRESNTSPHAHEQTFTYLFPRLPHTRVEAAVDLKHTSSELMRGSHGHVFGRTQG